MTAVHVVDNPAAHRFEADVGGQVAVLDYRRQGSMIDLAHTQVPPALEGQGVGSQLARAALDAARSEGLTVMASCSFVRAFIARHPEYQSLLAASERA